MRRERDLLAFLRRELAPSRTRWRATLRITLTVALSLVLIQTLHVPEGEFLLVTLFVLGPADAGASLEKARLRALGTLGGGAIGLLCLALVADKPWLFLPLQACVVAVAMFLARTTSAPYAFVLGAVTFVMVLPLYPVTLAGDVATGLWRTGLTTLGTLIATGGQLLFWPDDPEVLLLDDLSERVGDAGAILERLAVLHQGERLPAVEESIAVTGMTHQLDLLRNAETRSRWLRQRHTEQIALLVTVQRLVTATRRLARIATAQPVPAPIAPRLARAADDCRQVRTALAARRPIDPPAAPRPEAVGPALAAPHDLEARAAVDELERALAELPGVSAFLAQGDVTTTTAPMPIREVVAQQDLWTTACTLANVEAIRFALKVALASTICSLLLAATHLAGWITALITCVVTAQSFVGASLRKAVLRFAGAATGGAIALFVLVGVMPAMTSLGAYLIVVSAAFGAAAWVVTGSSRLSYVGLQMAIVLALTLVTGFAPTTDLAPPANRIAGVLLGALVIGVVDATLWPVRGETAVRRALAAALRQIGAMHRAGVRNDGAARRAAAVGVYRTLGGVLAMLDDLDFEPGAGERAATHAALLRVIGSVERLFLDLLALGRHRAAADEAGAAVAVSRLDAAADASIERLAAALLEGGPVPPPSPGPLLALVPATPALAAFTRLYGVAITALDRLAGDLAALGRLTAAPPLPARPRRTPTPLPW